MTADPLATRLKPGSKRELIWNALWGAYPDLVPTERLIALMEPLARPDHAMRRQVRNLRGQLLRVGGYWLISNIKGVGYVVEARLR